MGEDLSILGLCNNMALKGIHAINGHILKPPQYISIVIRLFLRLSTVTGLVNMVILSVNRV